ncbi:hypothetical protein [Roseibium sp.]|uniref:hypothetical protein n=1 Tax=Roseibium sp. TaxID=1936156 RepID=UPI003A97B879
MAKLQVMDERVHFAAADIRILFQIPVFVKDIARIGDIVFSLQSAGKSKKSRDLLDGATESFIYFRWAFHSNARETSKFIANCLIQKCIGVVMCFELVGHLLCTNAPGKTLFFCPIKGTKRPSAARQ